MYAITVTLRSGYRMTAVINARSERHALAQVWAADTGRNVASVGACRTW